jgi:hypothetical protein
MLNIDSISSTSNYSVDSQDQLFTELTPEEGAMIEGGEYIILIRDAGPAKAGVPPVWGVSLPAPANPTVLQITNATTYNLTYSLDFDAPNAGPNLPIAPGQVVNFLGLRPTATASWDLDLLAEGAQERSQDLKPGRRYEFYEI